jgi:hypothetical protein
MVVWRVLGCVAGWLLIYACLFICSKHFILDLTGCSAQQRDHAYSDSYEPGYAEQGGK